jgi:hypothetical protein
MTMARIGLTSEQYEETTGNSPRPDAAEVLPSRMISADARETVRRVKDMLDLAEAE